MATRRSQPPESDLNFELKIVDSSVCINNINTAHTPAAWDPAALTFQISSDGVDYLDLYHVAETTTGLWQPYETGIMSVIPNSILLLPSDAGLNVSWLKLRSGTRSQPINQGGRSVIPDPVWRLACR